MSEKKVINVPECDLPTKPFSREELADANNERIEFIAEEFKAGFEFVSTYDRSVTFFGSSHVTEGDGYYNQARSLAAKISQLDYAVVSGGGPGIMEAANRGAKEAGGQSLGLTIELPNEQARNPYVTRFKEFYYFFTRKVCLSFSAEAFVFFPGGFGTFDELFEILTLIQTNKIPPVPVILFGRDFWNKLDTQIMKNLLDQRYVAPDDLKLYVVTNSEEEVVKIIKGAPVRGGIPFGHNEHDHNQSHP